VLVLDEADEMLDLGFLPDIERILAQVPDEKQTMLFSATMPGPIVGLARAFMRQPVHIRAEHPDEGRLVPTTSQHVFRAHSMDKAEMLARILQADGRGLTMVFCRTKRTAQKVADDLVERGFAAAGVHGDLGQGAREQALRAFRSGKIDVLVATDVAARGIDVANVTHVINYQCPEDEKVYLHRIGRTGRAGADGIAVTFVDWDDVPRWQSVNTALGLPFPDPPETYSTSPHLFEALHIPDTATGILPRSQRNRAGLGAEAVEDIGETGRRQRPPRVPAHAGSPRGRGSRDGSSGSAEEVVPRDTDRPKRRSRPRLRTRGGAPTGSTEPATSAPAASGGEGSGPSGDRPRRRRGGRGRTRAGDPVAAPDEA
ncbi:MAG: DEAD/DEAH box helicase, partial [Pseudonocardiales bacterium]